jgi:hypothetical protein
MQEKRVKNSVFYVGMFGSMLAGATIAYYSLGNILWEYCFGTLIISAIVLFIYENLSASLHPILKDRVSEKVKE